MIYSDILTIKNNLFVSYNFLKCNNISLNTIERWKERKVGSIITKKKRAYINYDTIPLPTRIKLPTKAQILAKATLEAKVSKYETKQIEAELKTVAIQAEFDKAIAFDATQYNHIYSKHFTSPPKVIEYSEKHSICVACVKLNSGKPKYNLKDIHLVYKALNYDWTITDYTRFTGAFKKWQLGDFSLVHPLTGKAPNNANATKITDYTKAQIEEYVKNPNQYTFEMIHKLVNIDCEREGKPTISLSTVKQYYHKPGNKARLSKYRDPQFYNRVVEPITRRLPINEAGDLYYGDGTPLQMFCWNKAQNNKIRLNLFVVMDVMSGKIVGIDLAETEDRYNVLSALKMAFDVEKILPFEYKYDNASATKTEEYITLKNAVTLLGCTFTPTQKGNPKEKSQVERFFNTFQTNYQRMVDGYIGEGIKSKRDNGRISTDFWSKCQTKDNLYTYESMVKIIALLISFYNNDKKGNKPSPNELFVQSAKKTAFNIDATHIMLLFWTYKTITVRKSEVITTIRHNDYIFDVYNHAIALKLAGKQVKMYYDENDLSSVHLFDLDGRYICECRQKIRVHEGLAGRTKENTLTLIKQAKHNAAIKNEIETQTNLVRIKGGPINSKDEDFKLLTPFGVCKAEQNGAESEMFNYMVHQKGIDLTKVKDYEGINDTPTQTSTNKYSKKYQCKNPSLEIIKETD